MKIIAITGSIGCGKTTLANICRDLGCAVYDVDAWVRRLYYQKDFLAVIKDNFPEVFLNGEFNKRALRNLVFEDNKKLKKLEALIHPFLKITLKKLVRKHKFSDDLFFIDIALLFEMGWEKYCDFIILADVDYEIQKKRVMKRDNISAEDFEKIVKIQMDNKEKALRSDVVVDTNKSLNLLKLEMLEIMEGLNNG